MPRDLSDRRDRLFGREPERAEQLRAGLRALAATYHDDGWVEQFRSAGLLWARRTTVLD